MCNETRIVFVQISDSNMYENFIVIISQSHNERRIVLFSFGIYSFALSFSHLVLSASRLLNSISIFTTQFTTNLTQNWLVFFRLPPHTPSLV